MDKERSRRERLREILFNDDTRIGRAFDIGVLVAIVLSLLTLFVESLPSLHPTLRLVLNILEGLLTVLFTAEYILRLYCAESPRGYALSFWGIIDLMAVLPPYLTFFLPGARYMLMLRAVRFLRIFRIFRLFAFINEGHLLLRAVGKSMHKIAVYFLFVLILVTCLGTLMFMVESGRPGTQFTDLGTSVYWAIVTMTTVGYGDITPVTAIGRLLSAFVMLLGYTIIAVPTGIVTATIIDETQEKPKDGHCPRCDAKIRKKDHYCSQCGEKL